MHKMIVVAIVVAVMTSTPGTDATPQYDLVTTYYSDATLTTMVGRKFEMCSGTWSQGSRSAYYDYFVGEPCSGSCAFNECGAEYGDMYTSLCNDTVDNDGDGLVDVDDPGCVYGGLWP
jgi:hypothetical protein